MKKEAHLLILIALMPCISVYSAWTDIIITSDSQLEDDAQFIVVTVNGTDSAVSVVIDGGSIGSLIVNGTADITMSGGTISNDFYLFDPENLDDDGIIRSPIENNISLNDTSTMIMSGGVAEGHINITQGAQMDLYGYGFQYIAGERPENGLLLGYWQNDQPVNLYFVNNSFDRVTLHEIPEPVILLQLSLGGLLMRKKK